MTAPAPNRYDALPPAAKQLLAEFDALDLAAIAAQKRADLAQLQALVERMPTVHMQFSVLEPDGSTTLQPCADWCYACRIEQAEGAIERAHHLADVWDDAPDPLVRTSARDLRSTLVGSPARPRTAQPGTCDASWEGTGGIGSGYFGPCTLRHQHDGPVHRDRAGREWLERSPDPTVIPTAGTPLTAEQSEALEAVTPPPGTFVTAGVVDAAIRWHQAAPDELSCACGQHLRQAADGAWIHKPPYTCAWSRPRCPHCAMPHDLTPGSLPMAFCESTRTPITAADDEHQPGTTAEQAMSAQDMERAIDPLGAPAALAANGWGFEADCENPAPITLLRHLNRRDVNCYDRNRLTADQARTYGAALLQAADLLGPSSPTPDGERDRRAAILDAAQARADRATVTRVREFLERHGHRVAVAPTVVLSLLDETALTPATEEQPRA
ncbi:hypothetical protein ABZ883_04755 [Streptomyces sp. NPDC046977]|uniref:hypothetical protein n=1 Tax=Streptomyces sp. NPDC046977 TaxID=3154703 RepID=UPI0033D30076